LETNIEIKVNNNEKVIKKVVSFYILRVRDMRTWALLTLPLIFVAIILSLIYRDYAPLSIVFFILGVVLFYIYYQRPIQRYLKVYRESKTRLFRLDDDKVIIIGKNIQIECLWAYFKKAFEIPSAFLLYADNGTLLIFPKSYFNNTQTLEQVRFLLSVKFSDIKTYN